MKKIAIIPLAYRSYNYGGTLQYYALEKAMESLGFLTKVLDVDNFGEKLFDNEKLKERSKKISINRLIHKMFWEYSNYKTRKIQNKFYKRNLNFDEFREKYILSYTPKEIEELNGQFDGYVSGSDQIWNPQWAKSTFFLDFAKEKLKVIYGASIGKKSLSEDQKKAYGELLKCVDAISVREPDAAEQLQPLVDKKIQTVIDPVFLLNSIKWGELIGKSNNEYGDFIFCYLLGDDAIQRKEIKNGKKRWKKKVVSIPYVTQRYILYENYADDMRFDEGPIDFLKMILYAECIITDSFHATAFSIIFHKKFIVLNREPKSSQMISRITTLLNYFGLGDYLKESLESIEINDIKEPNWDEIDLKINKLSNQSLDFLKEAFKSIF